MNEIKILKKIGTEVFFEKRKTFDYSTLTHGVVLGPNSYRGFHKIDKSKTGSKEAFETVFTKNKDFIITELKNVKNEKELDTIENEICKKLKSALKKNIDNRQLDSFNKLRKPIDIAVEHFIAMGDDFVEVKNIISPFLFLPLDSQMFLSNVVFSDSEIKELRIKRTFTFKDITDKQHYYEIQEYLKTKAQKLGIENRIYFDLIWGDRYKRKSSEIFTR
jgi:hypothetical protein